VNWFRRSAVRCGVAGEGGGGFLKMFGVLRWGLVGPGPDRFSCSRVRRWGPVIRALVSFLSASPFTHVSAAWSWDLDRDRVRAPRLHGSTRPDRRA